MPLGPSLAAFAVVALSLLSSILAVDASDPLSSTPAALVGLSLITLGVVAASGLLLARGRWARWLSTVVAVGSVSLVATLAIDTSWQIATSTVALVGVVAAWPGSRGWLRERPSAQGPPPEAVALLLGLVAFPALVGAANPDGVAALAVAGALVTFASAVVYSRAGVGALWALRCLTAAGVTLAVTGSELPRSLVVFAGGAVLVLAGWLPVIRQAAAPLIPLRSPGYKIPAELAPPEILDAAGLDERGRRR